MEPVSDNALLDAHAGKDFAALIGLYAQAADEAQDLGRECFFLTYAYVFALESGDPRAAELHARLVAYGREA